ncbi:YqaA family protein [Paenibacillus sp. PAMC21692]|uniref:YqaA family protein n=1 Tax=Paenibacillus sp. PAMC21692 TaxID=2762320 RepID=UPI00164E04F3|nr:VTT domain-containing protein [Paenibacillus sp. PAMC21692]QNK56237.1 DedA family protein [Paenibacillus sp. PAMC21692]
MFQAVIDFLEDYGPWGLFVHSFLDAVIFPIPAFFLQVSLSILNPSNALWLATFGYIACLLGTPVGYLIGKVMGKSVLYRFLKTEWIDAATSRFQKNGEAAILIGSFTPIPFKVFTILSGCLNFPLWRLIGYAALGRAVKFYAVGALFYFYGRAAESMVKDVSLYIFIGGVPLIALFLFIRSRIRKRKEAATAAAEPSEQATAKTKAVASTSDSTDLGSQL